jgi:hypothetical protein
MLLRMKLRAPAWQVLLVAAGLLCAAQTALAVPLGYRYVGSRVVSEGRVVLWYWNADHVEIDQYGVSFVARMYARAVDVNQERPFVAVVRCDSRTYRPIDSRTTYAAIDDGEPIAAVWQAGCDKGVAVNAVQRYARLNAGGATDAPAGSAAAPPPAPPSAAPASPAMTLAQSPAPAPESSPGDPRRADACVRFAETRSPAGDGLITNTAATRSKSRFATREARETCSTARHRRKGAMATASAPTSRMCSPSIGAAGTRASASLRAAAR